MKSSSIRYAFIAFAMSAGPALAGSQSFPLHNGQVEFVMPSGNIGCVYTRQGGSPIYTPADGGPELQCDRVEPSYLRFVLSRFGKAKRIGNVGDQGCCGAPNTLQYGSTWNHGPFTCS